MRIGVNIGPTSDWSAMLAATKEADQLGFDAVGFLDHYHSDEPEWQQYICGWSAYGALAMATSRIHLVPMVIDRMNYLPGVLAKEVATLSILSNGRFELGIGAGDFFQEARAWGLPIPPAPERISGLAETVAILHRIWQGEVVTFEGKHLHLNNAASVPVPPARPRIVVGAGNSRSLIQSAVHYADEINVYADDDVIRFARQAITDAQRAVTLSTFVWDWLENIEEKLTDWEKLGVERTFITFWHPFDRLAQLSKKNTV